MDLKRVYSGSIMPTISEALLRKPWAGVTYLCIAIMSAALLCGCAGRDRVMDGDGMFDLNEDRAKEVTTDDGSDAMEPGAFPVICVGDSFFNIYMSGTPAADALFENLRSETIEIVLTDDGSSMLAGELPWELPASDTDIGFDPGDLILREGRICVCYASGECRGTQLGRLNAEDEEIEEAFAGAGDIEAEFYLEWTE